MGRGRKTQPELVPTERKRIAARANSWRNELLGDAEKLDWNSDDRKQLERQAQSLNTFSNLLTRDR